MSSRLRRPALRERVSHLGYLLKHTATIVGRDADILQPLVRMGVYAAVMVTAFFAAVWLYAAGGSGTPLLLLAMALFVYKYFYYNRQELAMSWLVYETACGRDRDLPAAQTEVKGLRRQARILALLDMAAAWISSQNDKEKQGPAAALMGSVISEGWDLVNHFLLPAFAIERLNFKEGLERLKAVRENVPETLMGVFGIDIFGRVVGGIMAPLYFLLALAGIAAGVFFASALPEAFSAGPVADLIPPDIMQKLHIPQEASFNWFPLAVCIFLGKLVSAVFERVVITIKIIYFTLFFTRTLHAESLDPSLRTELDRYLDLSSGASPAAA